MGNLICRHRLVLNVKFDCLKIESCVVLITRIVADFNHIWSQIFVCHTLSEKAFYKDLDNEVFIYGKRPI